jgi:hypothetical protein
MKKPGEQQLSLAVSFLVCVIVAMCNTHTVWKERNLAEGGLLVPCSR